MTTHHVEAIIHEGPEAVSALLAHRPSSWLRGFLVLAVRAPAGGGAAVSRPRYRLGRARVSVEVRSPAGGGPAVVIAPFVWWPHSSADVFARFRGSFRVAALPAGCELDLVGEAAGGRPERTDQVLLTLVGLIGDAIDADQLPAE